MRLNNAAPIRHPLEVPHRERGLFGSWDVHLAVLDVDLWAFDAQRRVERGTRPGSVYVKGWKINDANWGFTGGANVCGLSGPAFEYWKLNVLRARPARVGVYFGGVGVGECFRGAGVSRE